MPALSSRSSPRNFVVAFALALLPAAAAGGGCSSGRIAPISSSDSGSDSGGDAAAGCATSADCPVGDSCDPVIGRCCSAFGCAPKCPNGVLNDPNGCATCQCAPAADAGSTGVACTTDADCANAGVCGYLESAGCAAAGACFPARMGARCAIPSLVGCGCNGNEVSVDPSCYSGLPAGYQTKPILHQGPCTDGSSPALRWYMTCGDPSCRVAASDGGPLPDAGLRDDAGAPCPPVGSSCTTQGQGCGTRDPYVDCGATEVCSDQDPKSGVGGCPISSRQFKDDVEYVAPDGLERLHDQALRIRLATYRYKPAYGDSSRNHLGFIIEDDPRSPAVDVGRDRVDMYGYVSMAVAAMQVQEREIAKLRQEVDELRADRKAACASAKAYR